MKKLLPVLFVIFILSFSVFGQITRPTPAAKSGEKTSEVQQSEQQVNLVTNDVGRYFKEGMIALKDQKRFEAGEKFNKSVEVFLLSTLNVQSNPKLLGCYNQLIETVYRMEFPATQPPNIRSLSATCEWNWSNNDFLLADEIAKIVQISPVQTDTSTNTALLTSAEGKIPEPDKIQVGFNEQTFEASPLDELAKLELLKPRLTQPLIVNKIEDETWQSLATKLGFTAAELRALNGNAAFPSGKVFIPSGNLVPNTNYSRPTNPSIEIQQENTKIVKALAGDTVAKLAERHGASPVEVAKFNGLFTSSKLPAGHEIKIPERGTSYQYIEYSTAKQKTSEPRNNSKPSIVSKSDINTIGQKPIQQKNGNIPVIIKFFNDNLNDPYSMKIVRWSNLEQKYKNGSLYWAVYVKYRAKNIFGAYVLTEQLFYIRSNKIVGLETVY